MEGINGINEMIVTFNRHSFAWRHQSMVLSHPLIVFLDFAKAFDTRLIIILIIPIIFPRKWKWWPVRETGRFFLYPWGSWIIWKSFHRLWTGSRRARKNKMGRAKRAWRGGIFPSPDHSRLSLPACFFPSPITQSGACSQAKLAEILYTKWEEVYATFAMF